jgi:hypothetical protein
MKAKPKPPDDLWERMEEVRREAGCVKPEGKTSAEYRDKFGLSRSAATRELGKLLRAGKYKAVRFGVQIYYSPAK